MRTFCIAVSRVNGGNGGRLSEALWGMSDLHGGWVDRVVYNLRETDLSVKVTTKNGAEE